MFSFWNKANLSHVAGISSDVICMQSVTICRSEITLICKCRTSACCSALCMKRLTFSVCLSVCLVSLSLSLSRFSSVTVMDNFSKFFYQVHFCLIRDGKFLMSRITVCSTLSVCVGLFCASGKIMEDLSSFSTTDLFFQRMCQLLFVGLVVLMVIVSVFAVYKTTLHL